MTTERLQKLMARAGLGSRRANEKIIRQGRVRVDGVVATLGDKADPAVDRITVDGEQLSFEKRLYIMLYKPRGVLSSTEDEMEDGRTTVTDLVPIDTHIYPVGRLDKPSEGLILLTNDGKLAHRLTHPRFEHEKIYEVSVEGRPKLAVLELWRQGVLLDDKMTAPAGVEVLELGEESTDLRITLREGRKRQIRRVAAMLGHPVQRLLRTHIGPLALGDLGPGEWRHLTEEELESLKKATGLASRR